MIMYRLTLGFEGVAGCNREKIFANFADLFLFAKILFANITCARRARPLSLVRGVANVFAKYANASHS